jgi:D-alanyl-D-alanine carboxypeptidase/D-alanyl-D-alanine-endopeptidase (penicillin-binding protein 4)
MIRRIIQQYFFLFIVIITYTHCVTSKLKVENQSLKKYLENSEAFRNSFTGFSLYNPVKDNFLFRYNDQRFFTPASNTKLFTFYAAKKIFADSIPGIKYTIQNDTLYFTGSGDPTFLDEDFHEQPVFEFLKNTSKILVYCEKDLLNERYGPGWAWDDYMYYYSPEKSSMPIYSNVIRLNRIPEKPGLSVRPSRFKRSIIHIRDTVFRTTRAENENEFKVYHDQYPDTIDIRIPFKYSTELFLKLLADTLRKPISHSLDLCPVMTRLVYSQHVDSVMKKYLLVSDNFIAEQLLIMGAGHLSDSLDADLCIGYALENLVPELKDQIHWVDGSGLSRYNKFTPQAMVALLRKIYSEYPKETIIELFPNGGVSGTLKNNFKNEVPYIVAKTGSLSNVYNLSGFLITKKGRWLIFSFMNNNFEVPSALIKSEMENILKNIYLRF